MNIEQVENNLKALLENFQKEEFIFGLLLAYGLPKATVNLLKKGRHNLSKQEGRIILKNKLFFQVGGTADLYEIIDSLTKDPAAKRYTPRFIIVTDYLTLLAVDTKTNERLDISVEKIVKHYDFFLPWAGIEKHKHTNENPADRKAAEKMARLYDQIVTENIENRETKSHDFNVFLARLLFCFFAEDTGIFEDKLFTNSIASHTQIDGSDFGSYLNTLFDVLNSKERSSHPQFLQKFPYVNGGLFAEKHWTPIFSARSRKIIIECGELDWSKINPDIFGSMIQAVVHTKERASLGMHYTSVPNIMKVIKPLFLDDLREEFELSKGNTKKLQYLLQRITQIKFFDPACGSGNFLIITYKELRRLEMDIINELGIFAFPGINLSQFYGIELDDFAHEIAKLSLYLAEHQMNIEFQDAFGEINPTLPLKAGGNIEHGNATRINWEIICPKNDGDEIYILGNPPYLGYSLQTSSQKKEIEDLCRNDFSFYKELDYVACWFIKASDYIQGTAHKFAFVSTNSICQGEQVFMLWPYVFLKNLEIFFAHQSFKWENNAKKNAGVTCVIVGVSAINAKDKILIGEAGVHSVPNINAYLLNAPNVIVERRSKVLSGVLQKMVLGSMAKDGGFLYVSPSEKSKLILNYPTAHKFLKKALGSVEFIRGEDLWCLWIEDEDLESAKAIPFIEDRLRKVAEFRSKSTASSTNEYVLYPNRFKQRTYKNTRSIIVPRITSERRKYILCGFLDTDVVVKDSAYAIYDAEPWIFGIVSSRMHMVWVSAVAGRLKTDYRYSSALCYNTFPIPTLTTKQKQEINRHVFVILEQREKYSEKTMAELYDPDKMPVDLKEAHHELDLSIERCYRSKLFTGDEERLEYLFKLYGGMVEDQRVTK